MPSRKDPFLCRCRYFESPPMGAIPLLFNVHSPIINHLIFFFFLLRGFNVVAAHCIRNGTAPNEALTQSCQRKRKIRKLSLAIAREKKKKREENKKRPRWQADRQRQANLENIHPKCAMSYATIRLFVGLGLLTLSNPVSESRQADENRFEMCECVCVCRRVQTKNINEKSRKNIFCNLWL